ncbi:MAG: hypothetical protein HOI95_21920, partial [Chromatiales bacterium]|nr:hypothetical protein [Chromatiales bacterium]
LYQSVRDNVFSLPDTCALYPGHDYKGLTVTSVAEEKQHNPRLGEHMSQQAFIDMMDNPGAPVSETHRYRHASQPAVRT